MNRYNLLCTEEQTIKAFKLGAPIETQEYCPVDGLENDWFAKGLCFHKPTVEQMIGWLRSKNILFHFDDETDYWSICDASDEAFEAFDDATPLKWYNWSDNKELKAIDAALEYLMKEKLS